VPQVPLLAVRSQAWHWPVQVPSQHTPSVQKPELHSLAVVQVSPKIFLKVAAKVWFVTMVAMVYVSSVGSAAVCLSMVGNTSMAVPAPA
jgi:hypothetical protein